MSKSNREILLLSLAAALAVIVVACAGGGAPLTPTKAAATTAATTGAAATPTGATVAATTTGATKTGEAPKGDANVGKQLIVSKGCSSCHTVPGVPEAKGTVGPNLGGFASRTMIAGTLPNNPENLEKWLKNPPGAKPGAQMPNLNLSEKEIENLSAFLYTLK